MMPSQMLPLFYKMLGHTAVFTTVLGGAVASIDFRDQITLGSVIIAALIVLVAGMITIRSKIANIWREEAEGERAAKERLQEELNDQKLAYSEFEKHQQELRHDLKGKIAELSAQIKVFEAKTDLTSALEAIHDMARAQDQGHHETHVLLQEIRDKLPSEPLSVADQPIEVKDMGGEHV